MHDPQDPQNTTLAALPAKLGAEHILSLLPSLGYQAVRGADAVASTGNMQIPLYFTHAQMVVLPPSTDNPNSSRSGLNGIETNMTRAISGDKSPLLDKDLILFPVFEEWQPSGLSWEPRQHWVLLVYVKATKTVYLLDAMGPRRGEFCYGSKKLAHMVAAVKKALGTVDCAIEHPLEKMYFDRQPVSDTVSGGHWVAYWIHRFNQAIDLAALQVEIAKKTLLDVKADLEFARQSVISVVQSDRVEAGTDNSDHDGRMSPSILEIVSPESIERQKYGQLGAPPVQSDVQAPSAARSILFSPSTVDQKKAMAPPPVSAQPVSANTRPWYRFNLDLYSMLIYAGAAIALLAMFCMASATPLLSATVSAGALGVGVVLFVGGVLGKCGLFSRHEARHDTALPSNQHSAVLV